MAGTKSSAGGGATHAGVNYQDYVTAWVAVQILAEQDVSPPWRLRAPVTLEALHAEAPRPIDDLRVFTSAPGRVYIQAKHTVNLETELAKPLGKTINQFVTEYATATTPFDPQRDRFVLATSPHSSAPIKFDLPAFLNRMRTSPNPDDEWTAANEGEQHAAAVFREHLIREWHQLKGQQPTSADVNSLARLIHIHVLDVDPDGQAESEAKNTLRQRILKNPVGATSAWNTLVTTTGTYAVGHQQADRHALQQVLLNTGLDLQPARSFHQDIAALKEHTANTLDVLTDFSRISANGTLITIQREAATDLVDLARDGHLLILGLPGAGKSGALYELAQALRNESADVLVLAVDQIEAASLGDLRSELNLQHELLTVLANWPGTNPGFVVIDALDAARSEGAIKTLQTLMDRLIKSKSRWRVISSVRKFDLRYNTALQHLFQGAPSPTHRDLEFPAIRHVNIGTLSDCELIQVGQQSPELAELITNASAALKVLLRLPFNLRLLAELLATGTSAGDLQPIATQLELLDRYWQARIIRADHQGDARELVLRRVTRAMVRDRALRIPRSEAVADEAGSGVFLQDLLSTHVVAEWTTSTGKPQHEFITFPHHLLFDYAVARLYVPPQVDVFLQRLVDEPDLLVAIRPSIEIHYQRLWDTDPESFWVLTVRALEAQIPEIGKLIGPTIAAQRAGKVTQLQPLVDLLSSPTPAERATGIAILRHAMVALLTQGMGSNASILGPWITLLDQIS